MNGREQQKRYAITVDMTPGQSLRVRRAAKAAGQSRAEWMRRAAEEKLSREPKAKTEAA